MRKTTLLFVLAPFLVACGPKLSFEGSRVQLLAAQDELGECQPISGLEAIGGSKEAAEIELRNKAGVMNADRVVISDTLEAGGEVKLKGKAYSCTATKTGGPAPVAE